MPIRRGLQAAGVAALCLLVAAGGMQQAQAKSARQRLREILGRQEQVEEQLRNIKAEQATANWRLSQAQKEAAEARAAYRRAEARLAELRSILRKVKADLAQTEEELAAQREAMSKRLLALYQAGQPSYLEVVLNATSFEDFTNRAEFSRRVARRDQELLTTLVQTQERLAAQRAELEAREREAAELRTEAARQKAAMEARESEAESLVARIRTDRAAAEAEYAALQAAEREMAAFVRAQSQSSSGSYAGTSTGQFLMPCSGRISSPFGWRVHPVWGIRRFHNGVDIAAPAGTTIRAADDGKVTHAGWWGAYGRAVIIDHGSGWSTMYGHCSAIYVSVGQVVSRGQRIAAVGSTGVSTGNHLHWTVYRNGEAINPLR
ncbi:MAG: murein hydrolase activator EnvC [Armatimonadota bacterium]